MESKSSLFGIFDKSSQFFEENEKFGKKANRRQ
jgi:hypothetical protein